MFVLLVDAANRQVHFDTNLNPIPAREAPGEFSDASVHAARQPRPTRLSWSAPACTLTR